MEGLERLLLLDRVLRVWRITTLEATAARLILRALRARPSSHHLVRASFSIA